MTQYGKPQKGNPHQLTLNQHTFPSKNIERFVDSDGRVHIHMKSDELIRRAKSSDGIFEAALLGDLA
jgi:hypothetical protein